MANDHITAVALCADAECSRTLKAAIAQIMPVADVPPEQGDWLLVAEENALLDYIFSRPPIYILVLGETVALPESFPIERLPLPFRLSALLTRLQAIASRPLPLLPGSMLLLDAATRLLIHAETSESVELTEKETRLLEVLIQAAGEAVDKEHLLAEVWAYQPEVNTRTLETHLSRLRAKLPASVAVIAENGGYRIASL